jgi:murein DD-endopeptidase MepM/ murein hydrolase activator NlpD
MLLSRLPSAPLFDQIRKLDSLVVAQYLVQPGEDLWSIWQRYKIDQFTIRSSNDLDSQFVPAGTILRIPNHTGTLYQVQKPENLQSITRGFSRGKSLGSAYDQQVLFLNDFPLPDLKDSNRNFGPGTLLFLPDAFKPTGLQLPFSLRYKTSGFGMRRHPVLGITRPHNGYDLARPYGTPVLASRAGVVSYAGWMGGYGNLVEIRNVLRNGQTTYTRYGHLSKIRVHEGQRIAYQQYIGNVGSTGISTGPHLHYEIQDENHHAINPSRYM